MPSRHAHRAALRRSKKPSCIAPAELPALPSLPPECSWQNPVVAYDYQRDTWQVIRVSPGGGVIVATVWRIGDRFATDAAVGVMVCTAPEAFGIATGSAWRRGAGGQ